MASKPHKNANRNDPCPCGSGLKYKKCCRLKEAREVETASPRHARNAILGVTILGLAMLYLLVGADRSPSSSAERSAASLADWTRRAAAPPVAWEYDPVENRHWHAGHGHWHDGPPPAEAMRDVSPPREMPLPAAGPVAGPSADATTPPAWFYDAARDQHWHAEHGHWHPGPPPSPELR